MPIAQKCNLRSIKIYQMCTFPPKAYHSLAAMGYCTLDSTPAGCSEAILSNRDHDWKHKRYHNHASNSPEGPKSTVWQQVVGFDYTHDWTIHGAHPKACPAKCFWGGLTRRGDPPWTCTALPHEWGLQLDSKKREETASQGLLPPGPPRCEDPQPRTLAATKVFPAVTGCALKPATIKLPS